MQVNMLWMWKAQKKQVSKVFESEEDVNCDAQLMGTVGEVDSDFSPSVSSWQVLLPFVLSSLLQASSFCIFVNDLNHAK